MIEDAIAVLIITLISCSPSPGYTLADKVMIASRNLSSYGSRLYCFRGSSNATDGVTLSVTNFDAKNVPRSE